MKILILSSLDYPSIRKDLVLINAYQNVYSIYYAFEGLYAAMAKKGETLENQTSLMLLLAKEMTQKEFDGSEIFFGLVPRKFDFDKVISYNFDTVSAQESVLRDHYRKFDKEFYTSDDITDKCDNIMEAIKLAQSSTKESD
jgi:hypothetical protein